uniref:DUF3715 domain-containing protein n=1 Tax=Oncorhynchus tshawytscha TaxID=74940 RepID=A0A8C8JY97_ONCTS
MEIENGAARGVLLPVLPGSEPFDNSILPPLQNMYMYEESKQSFRYNSAFLIKNTTLQERYEAFRTERRGMGYSEEELEESYGFLLFDDKNKANKLGETGVIPGHSTCSTLGDPSKGVYVSKYSDCLDLNRWYHGKSGYIAIIRLTKGRVRDVTENYTVNYTPPSNGFDCHVSEQLSAVSANTSSFLAFERTQYYMYELPGGGADSTVQPPSHACPFAIVAFSYWDTKTPASEDQEKSEEEKTVFHYYPWRGQLQISSQVYHVGLKSSTGPLIPAKLPTVMAVDGAIKMSDLRQKLPKAMFETCFIGEVSLEGMGWSLYELAPSEAEDTSLSQLTHELKEKDLALVIQLNDSGFLILLHSSHFLTYEDAGSNKPEVLQGMFVFPDSRAIQRDTKICSKKPSLSPEGLQVVPALNYAETEVEKCLPEQSWELRGLLEQHIQSYAALIHPGLTISPSREASIFPDQFDVPDALKYLYSTPKWTEMGWKCLKSYFHQPGSFELSVSRATELLAAGREERGDEPDDDVYYCLSSPEGPPMTPASLGGPEEEQSGGQSPGDTADTATYISNALAVSTEDFEKPGMTKADSNAPNKRVEEEKTLSSKEVQDKVQHVQPKEVQEEVPSDLTKPAVPAGDFAKPVLKKADSNAPETTLIPKEVQKELPYDLSQPVVLADDSGKPGKNKAVPGVEDEGTHLNAEEVQVDRQKEVKEDMLSDLSQPAENLRKAGPAALGKADCKAPEVGVANEGTNLHLKEVQKDMPSGLSQPAVSQEELKKPGPALATKPNIKAVETGVEDKGGDLPKKEVQEEVPCDLSQFAVSANVFAIAGMTVMTKATEVTEVSTSPASGDLPTVLVITATEGTATVVPHNENFGLINTESITKNSSSLPPAKVQERGGSALNGQRGKANEVNNLSTSDWRKRPRKRRRFSGLGKRVLRSSAADFEEEETEKGCLDSSKVYSLKKRKEMTDLVQLNPWKKKERMDVTQVRPLKMQRELMNLIQDLPLKKKKESKDSINFYPFKRKESVDLIHDGHPLKKKTDRWDLKAIISECGRIFVPHGSAVIAKDIESLKVMGKVIDHKQCADEMMVEACIKVPQPIETGDEPGLELIKSDENKDPHIWSSDSKDHPPEVKMADVDKMASQKSSELVQNKDMDFPSLEKHKKNSQFVAISLSKLKTVFSRRGKKKTPLKPVSEDQMLPLDKKSKADAGMESVHFSNSCKDTPDRITGAAEVAKEQTFGLDPKFALALGLTPRELHNNAPKSPEKSDIPLKQDIQSRLDLFTPQATSDQMSEALPSSPSATITLTDRGSPLKMKCKPADSIRKKWWLHYHTPTSFEKEKVAQPISSQLLTLNPDVRRVVSRGRPRTVKKDTSDASCPPADALTLLADLALSTSNNKVLEQQPDHLALQQQECCPSLLISDNSVKDGGSPHESDGEPESVLHALLKHPSVARLKLPPQSPSPKGLVVGSGERVVLVSQEHSYSLPPSSSLLLGLSGSTLQIPISEGLQPHRKDMVYGDGTQALRAFLCQEQDQNRKELGKESGVAPESMRKGIGRRQKFRRLRRFIEKDRSVQVTRLWKENYDFNSDSKFTNDPMDKTVIRALHGPWDFNIEDTNEQVQLIIHMWIGLFYSRSTARFFQADLSLLCMEEKDSTEVDHGMVQAQVTSETKTSSPAYIALSRIPEPEVLDRSNVGKKESQPLSLEPEALDLSVKTTSTVLDFTVDTKDSKQRIDLKSPSVYQPESGLHKEIISFHKQSTGLELKVYRDREDSMTSDKTSELDDDETNTHDNDSNGTLQNDVSPKRRNLESDGSYILLCEQAASVYINQEKVLETQRIDRGLEGKAKKEIQKEERSHDGEQNIARLKTMESKDVDEAQQVQDNDSVKTMSCTEVLGDGDLTNMADRVERNASEPRDGSYVAIYDGSESKMHKAYPSVEDSVEAAKPEAVHVGKDTTNKEINAQPAGNDSIGKALNAMHDEKIPKDVSRDDGNSKNEVQTALQEVNDNGDEAQTALQEGNDKGDEAQTALQEGNDNGDEAQTALQEGNDNGDEAQTALQEGNDNGDEAQTALQEGNDNGDEAQMALQEGNDNGDEAQTALQEGNDNGDEAQTALQEGNDNGDEAQPALQEGNDNGDEAQTALQEGNDNGDEAKTALQEGNDNGDEAQTALQEGNDNGDEAQTALQEGNDNGDEAQTALQEGNDNGDEALPAVNYEKESGDKAAPAVCGGNNYVAETPPEISHNENDSQKETLSVVHGGNDSTLPVDMYSKLYIDEEPTDEVQPMELVGNVSVGTTRVLLEMQVEIKSNDEVLTTRVFPLCDGNMPFVGEFDTSIQSKDVSAEAKTTAVETDFNGIRDSKDQKRISVPGQSKSDIGTQGPRHSQDETSEVLTGQVEIPLIGAGIPREDISHTDVLHSHSQTSETVRAQIEIPFIGVELPFIGVETDSKDIMHTEVHDTHLCQKDTPISSVCHSDNLFSGEMFRIVSKANESVSRCPTPIVDDGYIPIPDIHSGCLVNCDASGVGKPLSRCPTPTQDEPPFVTELSYYHHTPKTVFLPDLKDTNSPNLNSVFALIENEKAYCEPHEPSLGSSPSSVENMLHELRKSSNNNSKPNNLEAIGNQFSQLWTEPRKKPIATSTPLNTPYTSSKEKNDYSPYSNMRLTPAEQDLYALSSHNSLHRFPASYPKTHSTVTQKAAFSVPSTYLEVQPNDTTERILTRDLSEIALEGDTNLCPASTENIIQSFRQNIPGVSGPTAASQNLSGPNFTEPHPYSQQLAMAVNLSKSEGSRGEYSWKEGQTNIDPMSSDVVKSKQTAAPVHSNTNPHPYNTPYVTEMRRQIASLQDYVMDESEEPAVEQDNIESSLETNWISDDQHASNTSQLNKTKLDFINSLREYQQWDKREFDDVLDFSKQGNSSSVTFQSEESDKIFTRMEENKQDWLKYCRSERSGNTSKSQIDLDNEHEEVSSFAKPCLVTVLDHKGNRITYENYPVLKPSTSTHTWTAPNSNRQGSSSFLEFSKRWDDTHNTDESDLTQSSVDLETLIFSERMNQMLKRKRKNNSSRYNRSKHHRSTVEERASSCSPAVTVHFSSLQEQESSEEHWEGLPSLAGQKLKIDMPERKGMPEETDRDMPQHLQKLSYTKGSEMTHVNVSDLVAESFKAYHAMMTEVCAGRKYPHRTERLKREEAKRNSLPKSRTPSKDKDFCGQMKKDMYDSLHDNLNSVVKQSCKNKFRFYILVTSDDPFFNETKELLEAEGHITVEQSQFCLGKDSPSSPLYIILRNEDIAEHICEVPHLLELKKSQNVLFAGIDRPDDIVNLTHQELFSKGGFVVFEGAALDTLSLSNIKKMSGFLEGLSKKGKWKWLLHYKDSRKLKESARSSAEAQGKKSFMDNCQEAGMVEVLPYHECDVISRTRPNYLHCLVRLQVQNVSARLPVFITDTTADKAFAKHGIFTMNINSFLLISQSDTCTIS